MPEKKCNCEVCQGPEALGPACPCEDCHDTATMPLESFKQNINAPLPVKIACNIATMMFVFHLTAFNLGIAFAKRKRAIIASNNVNYVLAQYKRLAESMKNRPY